MQDVGPVSHQLHVLWRAVHTLSIADGSLEHVTKLDSSTEEVWPHKVYHTPVLYQVILEGISR